MNSLYVAWRYLSFHRVRSVLLILALAIIIFVPLFLNITLQESQERLSSRADTTPLILGAKGSSLDLVLSSLYFGDTIPRAISEADVKGIERKLATTIPLHTAYRAGDYRIVGTVLEYFDLRGLKLSQGHMLGILGDAVLGAKVAKKTGLNPGDHIVSSPDNVFDLAGTYPLKLNIVGTFAATGTADDDVIFVDVRTTWVISGYGHGHDEVVNNPDPTLVERVEDGNVVANANVQAYTEITPDNLDSFHFHGDASAYPLTAAIVLPKDERNGTLLLGRYQGHESLQLLEPKQTVTDLLSTMFRIKKVLDIVVIVVSAATLLTVLLVFLLSLRLRAKELATIFRLGSSRNAVSGFVVSEIAIIATGSLVLATLLLALSAFYRSDLITRLLS